MIKLSDELAESIIEHAKNEFPNEACGILAGENEEISKVFALTNIKQSSNRYLADAKEQFEVIHKITENGQKMMGIYHSHIASAAYPSKTDIELAFYDDVFYFIVSLEDMANPQIKAFSIKNGKVTNEEFELTRLKGEKDEYSG